MIEFYDIRTPKGNASHHLVATSEAESHSWRRSSRQFNMKELSPSLHCTHAASAHWSSGRGAVRGCEVVVPLRWEKSP